MKTPVDVSFGGRVDAEERRAHGATQAGEVDDGALLAIHHLRKDKTSHLVDARDIAVDEFVDLKRGL